MSRQSSRRSSSVSSGIDDTGIVGMYNLTPDMTAQQVSAIIRRGRERRLRGIEEQGNIRRADIERVEREEIELQRREDAVRMDYERRSLLRAAGATVENDGDCAEDQAPYEEQQQSIFGMVKICTICWGGRCSCRVKLLKEVLVPLTIEKVNEECRVCSPWDDRERCVHHQTIVTKMWYTEKGEKVRVYLGRDKEMKMKNGKNYYDVMTSPPSVSGYLSRDQEADMLLRMRNAEKKKTKAAEGNLIGNSIYYGQHSGVIVVRDPTQHHRDLYYGPYIGGNPFAPSGVRYYRHGHSM